MSGRVRLSDLRRAYRLIHDCRDVGHDPAAWSAVLVEGLAQLVDGQLIQATEIEVTSPEDKPGGTLLAERGWPSPAARALWWETYVLTGEFRRSPTFIRYSAIQGNLVTRSREQLVEDGEWYRSVEFNESHRVMGLDDLLSSNLRFGDPPTLYGFQLMRLVGQERFRPRERRLVRIFHRELVGHVGRTLVREPGRPMGELPPRLRQTLDCLLEGDSEKQAAHRMGLSRHTVHEYVTDLYRRLGVSSRPELMALCLRHCFRPQLPSS